MEPQVFALKRGRRREKTDETGGAELKSASGIARVAPDGTAWSGWGGRRRLSPPGRGLLGARGQGCSCATQLQGPGHGPLGFSLVSFGLHIPIGFTYSHPGLQSASGVQSPSRIPTGRVLRRGRGAVFRFCKKMKTNEKKIGKNGARILCVRCVRRVRRVRRVR